MVSRKFRTFLPVVSGVVILAASLAYVLAPEPSRQAVGPPAEEALQGVRGGDDAARLDLSDLPSVESIVRHSTTLEGGVRHHQIEWYLPDPAVPGLIRFMEEDHRVLRYHAGRGSTGWRVDARIVDGPSSTETHPPDGSNFSVSSILKRPALSEPPATAETSEKEEAAPGDDHSGSGFVRFTDRGTMYWLWDEEVLRLEQVR
jgi:hypothetical protein